MPVPNGAHRHDQLHDPIIGVFATDRLRHAHRFRHIAFGQHGDESPLGEVGAVWIEFERFRVELRCSRRVRGQAGHKGCEIIAGKRIGCCPIKTRGFIRFGKSRGRNAERHEGNKSR